MRGSARTAWRWTLGDLPTAEDLRRAALYCPTSIRAGARQLPRLLHALADALDAGTVRLVRTDDEQPEDAAVNAAYREKR